LPGLYYLREWYYDPSTAQFLSRDPSVAATRSPYSYVAGHPLNKTDPSGLCTWNPFDKDSCEIAAPARAATAVSNGATNAAHTADQPVVISCAGCFVLCANVSLQDGYVTGSVGCCGVLGRGPGIGWANLTPDQRSSQSIMTGGAYGVGIGGSIGLDHPPKSANDISRNPDDWEIHLFPGIGGNGGYQQSTDPISVLPWH